MGRGRAGPLVNPRAQLARHDNPGAFEAVKQIAARGSVARECRS